MLRKRFRTTIAFTLGLVLACNGDDGPSGPNGNDGVGTVGPAGGSVRLEDEAGVTVPAGALGGEVTITITAVATPDELEAAGAIGQAYRFGPEGQQFQVPVEVFVFVPNSALSGIDPADLTLLSTSVTGLEELEGITVDIGASGITVRGHVTHFSVISAAVESSEPPPNRAPNANAGVDQDASAGSLVTLDARASSDPDSDPLTFSWRTLVAPAGVSVSLSGATTAQPTFTPAAAGVYEFELTVSDGELASRDTVRVTVGAANRAPVVDAGADRSVTVGAQATVTATASDPDGDPLTFSWTVQSRPAGSSAQLSATNTLSVSLIPDVAGAYVLRVTVADGRGGQDTDEVTITATAAGSNRAPVANAGVDQQATETIAVTLDGTGSSDPDGDALTYAWTIVSRPDGSTAGIMGSSAATASFTPDREGVYVIQLQVSDGQLSSTDTVTITVAPFNPPPSGTLEVPGGVQVIAGASVIVNASFTDPEGEPLDFTWTLDAPDGSSASLSVSVDERQATFTADLPGEYRVGVAVTDGQKTTQAGVTVTAFPSVGGTYETKFTLTFVSNFCPDELGLEAGQSQVVPMTMTQSTPASVILGISALIPNVQSDPVASLSPAGLAVFSGPIGFETGTGQFTATGNITVQFAFANGPAGAATGFDGNFSFSVFPCTIQGTLESPAN